MTSNQFSNLKGPHWTPERIKLHTWLLSHSAALSELYQSCVIQFFEIPIPGRGISICHNIREIRNRLPEIVRKERIKGRVEYTELTTTISEIWQKEMPAHAFQEIKPPVSAPLLTKSISNELFNAFEALVKEHRAGNIRVKQKDQQLLSLRSGDRPQHEALIKQWGDVTDWFKHQAHINDRNDKSDKNFDWDLMVKNFLLFEQTLLSLTQEFYATSETLDALLNQANKGAVPTDNDIDKAMSLIILPGHIRHFFETLNNPHWALPLKKRGFFKHPPEITEGQNYGWPESEYLARISKNAETSSAVSQIADAIPETENYHVYEDLIQIASNLNPSHVRGLVRRISTWVKKTHGSVLRLETIDDLVIRLIETEQHALAVQLLKAVLHFEVEKRTLGNDYQYNEIKSRIDSRDLQESLDKLIPHLAKLPNLDGFNLLSNLLRQCILVRLPKAVETAHQDNSRIWLPSFEARSKISTLGFEENLAFATKNLGLYLLKNKLATAAQIQEILCNGKWTIHLRISCYLLSHEETLSVELANSELTKKQYFQDSDIFEFKNLLKKHFDILPQNSRQTVLNLIAEGPTKVYAPDDDQEFIQSYSERWKLGFLNCIESNIKETPDHKKFIEWKEKYGEPKESRRGPNVKVGWSSAKSPFSQSELEQLAPNDLINKVNTWTPKKELRGPTSEGLGIELNTLFASKPNEYLKQCELFEKLDLTYLPSFLRGISNHTLKPELNWQKIFILIKSVLEKNLKKEPNFTPKEKSSWHEVKMAILEFIQKGIDNQSIPLTYENELFQIFEVLVFDASPTDEFEERFSRNNDYIAAAFSAVRTRCVMAMFTYIFWSKERSSKNSFSLDSLPQIKSLLNHVIKTDNSLSMYAIYGEYFPRMIWSDAAWAKSHTNDFFGLDTVNAHQDIAWEHYITRNRIYRDSFELLKSHYMTALNKLHEFDEQKSHYFIQLGSHIFFAYLNGAIEFDDPLFVEFFKKAPSQLRGYVLSEIGRIIADEEEKKHLTEENIKRIIKFWEWRLKEAQNDIPTRDELDELGWWIDDELYPIDWLINILKNALTLAPSIELIRDLGPTFFEKYFTQYPMDILECLEKIIVGDKRTWSITSLRRTLEVVLTNSIQSTEDVKAKALTLINLLGERGYTQFREIGYPKKPEPKQD